MKKFLGLAVALSLLSCPAMAANPLDPIRQGIISDFTWASNDAKARGDVRHGQCWDAVLTFVNSNEFAQLPQIHPGVASALQGFFDLQGIVSKPLLPDYVVQGCALTIFDARASFVNLAARLGIAAALPLKIPTF